MGNILCWSILPHYSFGLLLIDDSLSLTILTVRVLRPVRGRVGLMIKMSKWSMDIFKQIDSNIWSLRIIVTDIGDVIIKCMTQFRPINWLDNESSIQEASYKWVEFEIQTRKMWEKQIFMKSKNNWLWAKKWIHKKIHWNVKMEQVMLRVWVILYE